MGLMTLEHFREDVQSALGDRGLGNPKLDRWINFAYLDVAGAIQFETFENDADRSASSGTEFISVPDNAVVVRHIIHKEANNLLMWVPKAEFYRLDLSQTGPPKKWTRHKDQLKLYPVPSATSTFLVIYKDVPEVLAATGDKTKLPDTWDPAIFYVAVHNGLMALGEEQRATVWMQKAVNYMQSRATEERLVITGSGLGRTIANPPNATTAPPQQGGQ